MPFTGAVPATAVRRGRGGFGFSSHNEKLYCKLIQETAQWP